MVALGMKTPIWIQRWVERWEKLLPECRIYCNFRIRDFSFLVNVVIKDKDDKLYEWGALLDAVSGSRAEQNKKSFRNYADHTIREAVDRFLVKEGK